MSAILPSTIIKIKKVDNERFKAFKQNVLMDAWSTYAFHDMTMNSNSRSTSGSFYTPEWIVTLMVNRVVDRWMKNHTAQDLWHCRILEPSCGSGNYVEVIVRKLLTILKASNPTRTDKIILKHIATHMLFAWDLNEEAIQQTRQRIKQLHNIDLPHCEVKDTLIQNDTFDLIIGNPPYGNLLSKNQKKSLNDTYNNIALSFLDWSYAHLKKGGLAYLIVPHSFSRTGGGAKQWRQEVKRQKSVFEVIDVGNPFFDITLEQIIVGLSYEKQDSIQTGSIRHNKTGNKVSLGKFYESKDDRMMIYWDYEYQKIKEMNCPYPFSGHRGKDVSKTLLLKEPNKDAKWFILGKNVSRVGLRHIQNYDRYIPNELEGLSDYPKTMLVITQFGTNLKASIIQSKDAYPSGGVVIINHEGLTIQEACDYLNNPFVNDYLCRYVLNEAELTVHLDGKYLKEIPYLAKL